MARLALGLTAALAAVAFAPVSAAAQSLAALHVRSFTLSSDRPSVRVGETFHLEMRAHVDERVLELDNVTLPDLSGFDVLGDERRCSASGRGSDCTETLTLSPNVAGDRTIGATTMDAIDARNRKPSRFATNTVALHVAGAPPHLPDWFAGLVGFIVSVVLPLALVALAFWALLWGFGRRKRAPSPPAPVVVHVPEPVVTDVHARLRALVAALASDPTRARALAVRAALRESISARDDETLADLVARRAAGASSGLAPSVLAPSVLAPSVLAALYAIERASFCEDSRVARAVEEALPSLNF